MGGQIAAFAPCLGQCKIKRTLCGKVALLGKFQIDPQRLVLADDGGKGAAFAVWPASRGCASC